MEAEARHQALGTTGEMKSPTLDAILDVTKGIAITEGLFAQM